MKSQIEFSLLAVHEDPLPRLREQLAHVQSAGLTAEADELIVKIATEDSKRERWAVSAINGASLSHRPCCLNLDMLSQFENSLRRHNYLGFIHALLLGMAKAGTLDAAKDGAKKALQERIEKRKKGEAMDED